MTPEDVLARRLAAEIEAELATMAALADEFASAPPADDRYAIRARGSMLHDFYNCVERVFLRIARELNGGVPRGEQWHRDLIDNMALEIPGVRPAVVDRGLADVLGEYLRFRHVFRDVYGGVLVAHRMALLEDRLPDTITAFRRDIGAFVAWMMGQPRRESRQPRTGRLTNPHPAAKRV